MKKILPLLLIFALIFFFFFRLFYPQSSIFMIPDFGESDVLHLNLSFKHILSSSLKNGQWPLWTPLLANGFPLLAEGQIGTFYLPNLILFRFLQVSEAYNLSLVLSFLISATGTYLLLHKLKMSQTAAAFGALVFTFSGFMSVHLNHFNLIQAASLLPLFYYSLLLLWHRPLPKYVFFSSFLLSQQIFTGHYYVVFITLLGAAIAGAGTFIFKIPRPKAAAIFLSAAAVSLIAFFLSAIQLIPTIELWRLSTRQSGLDFNTVTSYPYPTQHLTTFLNPYALGNPADATYPPFDSEWGIFWENTAYIGILPFILALISAFFLKKRGVRIGWILLLSSLLLVLGKNSPFYFVFSLFPFNLFRVPSKFLLLTTIALVCLAAKTVDFILEKNLSANEFPDSKARKKRKTIFFLLVVTLFVLTVADEYRFAYQYPPVSPESWWLNPPEVLAFLPKGVKIASLGATYNWNSVFLKKGWQDLKPYAYFRNSLFPNYNALFSYKQIDINTGGLIPRRIGLFNSLAKSVEIDANQQTASVSALTKNIFSLSGVAYLLSPYRLSDRDFLETGKVPAPDDLAPLFVYKNRLARERSYLVYRTKEIKTFEKAYESLSAPDFLDGKTVLVETADFILDSPQNTSKVEIEKEKDLEIILKVSTDTQGLLVLTDNNYPGWRAFVDGQPQEILTVNLSQKGVFLKEGTHRVKFLYKPLSFLAGKMMTYTTLLIISLAVFLSCLVFPHKASRKFWLFRRLDGKGGN